MSLRVGVGAIGNLLDERPEDCRRVDDAAAGAAERRAGEAAPRCDREGFRAATLSHAVPRAEGAAGLERALDALCRAGLAGGVERHDDPDPLRPRRRRRARADLRRCWRRPPCTRTWCARARGRCAAWWSRAGEPRETMHVALLLGYGAAAVNPYLALETLRALHGDGRARRADARRGAPALRQGIGKGLLKVCSKMGISTVQSYRGAQIFEAVGLGRRLVDRYFTGTVSRVGGLELPDIADEVAERHERGFPPVRAGGARASSTPAASTSSACAASTTTGTRTRSCACSARCATTTTRRSRPSPTALDGQTARCTTLRGLLELVPAARAGAARGGRAVGRDREAVRHRRDEPRLDLARGARDAGIAMNRLGGRSNTGEGGEDAARSIPDPNGEPAALGDQAGGIGALRRDRAVPRGRRPAADQDGPGREARRGRPAAGPQGRRADRAAAPLHARRRADLAAAAPRHLLDRGPGAADPRPEGGQPGGRDLGQARGRGGRRHDRRRRRQGEGRAHRDRRPRRRHRRLAALVAQARRPAVGARHRRGAAGAGHERPARPRAAAGRRRPAHRPRRARSARCSAPRSSASRPPR